MLDSMDADLEREDVRQAIEYAAWLTREEVRAE
jgi:uncharacterized protein (DUF433 family)